MKKRLKILVCGGRNLHNVSLVYNTLNDVSLAWDEICIAQGGCKTGGDKFARDWARSKGHPLITMDANWSVYDKAAGPIRNQWMLDWIKPDLVLAFPGGRGTADMVAKAKSLGLWVKEIKDKSDGVN